MIDWTQVLLSAITVGGATATAIWSTAANRDRKATAVDRVHVRSHAAVARRAAIYVEQSMPPDERPTRREIDRPSSWPSDADEDNGELER